MSVMTRSWTTPEPIAGDDWRALHADPVVAELLWRRGLQDAEAAADFLNAGVHAPEDLLVQAVKLPNFDAAVARGVRAVRQRERVAIFGDYDADGTTAAAMLTLFFGQAISLGSVEARLPTRANGYGLCPEDVDELARFAGPGGLLVVTDTGSSDHTCVPQAIALGLDVVILDHHQIGEEGADGPAGATTVSAYLRPETTPRDPLRDLTGAGLTWLYLVALADELGDPILRRMAGGLQDLAMLGTVADVADLRRLNRPLVRDGLRAVRKRARPGVAALCAAAGVEPATLTAHEASRKLAPRLNAAGRMGDPMLALELLCAGDMDEATGLANKLENRNTGRKVAMNQVIEQARAALQAGIGQPGGLSDGVLVAHGTDWHSGVLGPAASRILEEQGKPVVLLSDDPSEPGQSRGSARSIAGFDIAKALRSPACQRVLLRNGGHSAAAGITVRTADIPALAKALEDELDRQLPVALRDGFGHPAIAPDAELPADRLTLETARTVSQLGPFGQGNENPLFYVRNVPLQRRTLMGRDPQRQHLKLVVGLPGMAPAEVIVWGGGDRLADAAAAQSVDLAIRIGINRWAGQTKLEAIAEDFRLAR